MKIIIIINKKSGGEIAKDAADPAEGLVEKFKQHNIQAEVHQIEKVNIKKLIQSSIEAGIDAVVAAGGDGTISGVAALLAGKKLPLGILPFGTLNHFAKDLLIPLTTDEAIKIIAENNIIKIDLGEVNGNIFINNSSIGFYPKIVLNRKKNKTGLWGNKWLSMAAAFLKLFSLFPVHHVNVKTDNDSKRCKTPFVFVGNNEYKFDIFNLGSRENLSDGKLSLYYPNTTGRISMIKFALLALTDKLDQSKDFESSLAKNIVIEVNKRKINVSLDGEVIKLKPPLEYRIRPLALNVIAPKGT